MPVKSIFSNPLVQFFAAGLLIFGLYSVSRARNTEPAGEIIITSAEQKILAALFKKTRQRPPTKAELQGLIEARLHEELFYREALGLGLDKDDVIVRRRLAQKILFIADDIAARRDPTDKELAVLLKKNAIRYAIEPTITFQQVYFSKDRRGPRFKDDAKRVLLELQRGADPSAVGDPTILPRTMEQAPLTTISSVFGKAFARAVNNSTLDEWSGPIRSSYGAHIVKVTTKKAGRARTLDDARQALIRDWREEQRRETRSKYIQALKKKYRISIEQVDVGSR